MSSQEKLVKALDLLRVLLLPDHTSDKITRKKEKVSQCTVVSDAICNSSIKSAPNFSSLLCCSIETLLQLCDDSESDVRMVADECLNRVIRATADGNMAKIQVELHKEIKKNGSARTLRAALWRFALLCHMIRPHKGKPFIQSLVPCIIKIAQRKEDSVHETLADSLTRIMTSLGRFASDNEIKGLLEVFLQNLSNSSATVRRTSASNIVNVCQNCRKPSVFISFIHGALMDLVVPIKSDQPSDTLLGVFNCLRNILPFIDEERSDHQMRDSFGIRRNLRDNSSGPDKMIQVYELCLYYASHSDHNVVNAALETLHTLLDTQRRDFLQVLLSSTGIAKTRLAVLGVINADIKQRSLSQLSVSSSATQCDENLLLESDSHDRQLQDVENWIDNIEFPSDAGIPMKSRNRDDTLSLNNQFEFDTDEYDSFTTSVSLSDVTVASEHRHEMDGAAMYRRPDTAMKSTEDILSEPVSLDCTANLNECRMKEINIGDYNDADISLIYCCRKLAKLFLLTGYPENVIPDNVVRVSVKNLALTCISSIVKLYPNAMSLYLDKSYNIGVSFSEQAQKISDVLLFSEHSDPQLKGIVRCLVGNLIKSVLLHSNSNFDSWLESNNLHRGTAEALDLNNLISVLATGLKDVSSTCSRLSLVGTKTCLTQLLKSANSKAAHTLLQELPLLANNPYWLVKVTLTEVIRDIPLVTVYYVTGNGCFQDKIIKLIFVLLEDNDSRVRTAAATALVNLIYNLYYDADQPNQSVATLKAIEHKARNFSDLCDVEWESNIVNQNFIISMPFPFNKLSEKPCPAQVEKSLARIIKSLSITLLKSSSKYLTYGCCETLSLLSDTFYTTLYFKAWDCVNKSSITAKLPQQMRNSGQSRANQNTDSSLLTMVQPIDNDSLISSCSGLFGTSVALLTGSSFSLDITCHFWILNLAGNLFAGLSFQHMKPSEVLASSTTSHAANIATSPWSTFGDKTLCRLTYNLLQHVMKMLNIFHHIINEALPTVSSSKPILTNLSNASNLSPIKRKPKPAEVSTRNKLLSPAKVLIDKEDKGDKKSESSRLNSMGYFANSPHYMKLYENLKTAYLNFKITLDTSASEKFTTLLKCTLSTLCKLLETASLNETGCIAEELLQCLHTCASLEPATTVECVQQLLKCLFNTNLYSRLDGIDLKTTAQNIKSQDTNGFYKNIIQESFTRLAASISTVNSIQKSDPVNNSVVMGYRRRRRSSGKQLSTVLKSVARGSDKTALANYIRLFEPMVIKSLKQYTITSNVTLQCKVLHLLCQLVYLRVNYCLLDSDQIFIKFVLQQFEFIEEGQISNAQELISEIFSFLIHLSYEKHHSKTIIGVPEIINLCNRLMASGQSPVSHCIPALRPVIEDLFVMRVQSSTLSVVKELETTRDVLFSMLLRLVEYHQVFDLLRLVISETSYVNDNGEKWLKWSRQVVDALVPMLIQRSVRLETRDAQIALNSLLVVLSPKVFQPIDSLLKVLFCEPPQQQCTNITLSRWIGSIIAVFLTISQTKEDALLLRLKEISSDISPYSFVSCNKLPEKYDPLNVSNTIGSSVHMAQSDVMFAKFIFKTLYTMATFLSFCLYMFESGSHYKIAKAAMNLVKSEADDEIIKKTNDIYNDLAPFEPALTFQWCHLLAVLNYDNQQFWSEMLQIPGSSDIIQSLTATNCVDNPNINLEIIRTGTVIVYCDFIGENLSDGEHLTWFLVNNIQLIVTLSSEPPVAELISAVHRNSAASGLFIQAVGAKCCQITEPGFMMKLLKSLENVHPTQSGALLILIIPRLLTSHYLAVTRAAAGLASRAAELLLTMTPEQVTQQLPQKDITVIMDTLLDTKLVRKHESLVSLLNKIGSKFYDLSPLDLDLGRSLSSANIKNLVVNQSWYISQVRTNCHDMCMDSEGAKLLSKLEYNDLITIMASNDFNTSLFKECILYATSIAVRKDNGAEFYKNSSLINATIEVLFRKIRNLKFLLPKEHQVYNSFDRQTTNAEVKYTNRLNELFSDNVFWDSLHGLISPLSAYLNSLYYFNLDIADTHVEDICMFSILSAESIIFLIKNKNYVKIQQYYINSAVLFISNVLKSKKLFKIFSSLDIHVCSVINSVYGLVQYLLSDIDQLPELSTGGFSKLFNKTQVPDQLVKSEKDGSQRSSHQESDSMIDFKLLSCANACRQLSCLVTWLEQNQYRSIKSVSASIMRSTKHIIISLARHPLVNSYVLTPPDIWQHGWDVEMHGLRNTLVPPLPINFLQEIDILEQFIFRINLLGWTSRQQFEEMWMCLLSVLSSSVTISSIESDIDNSNIPAEDGPIIMQASCLAVQAVTSLLLQTLRIPTPGDPNAADLFCVPRNRRIVSNSSSYKKLKTLQDILHWEIEQEPYFSDTLSSLPSPWESRNIERVLEPLQYSYGQVSVEYLWIATRMTDNESTVVAEQFAERDKFLQESEVDLNSCIQFLLDLYSQWTKSQSLVPLPLLTEVVKSVLAVSDLFTERSQFQWMMNLCLELHKIHPIEDEILHQYLMLGICKCTAVLIPSIEMYELVKRIVETSLKSSLVSAQVFGLHGMMYLLESSVASNTIIGGHSDETLLFQPLAIEYIQNQIALGNSLNRCEEQQRIMWALAFYLLENVEEQITDTDIVPSVLQVVFSLLSQQSLSIPLYNLLLKGLERLILSKTITGKAAEQVTKLAIDKLKHSNPSYALPALEMLLICMYTEAQDLLDSEKNINGITSNDPEVLIRTLERTTAIFDRMKIGYSFEVNLLCSIVPDLLNDFFPPSEIFTKVIGEFLSQQQPYPKQLSAVVFQVFEQARTKSELTLLQDWVVFSLSNFTQSLPISMATWYLTCFFISASTNDSLRSLFPRVQSRVGKYDYEDRKMFCISGVDFYRQLLSDNQKQMFIGTFEKIAHMPGTPFKDLIKCLN